jgi:hypothetical protein
MVTLSWMSNSIRLNQRAGSLLIKVTQEILLPSPKDALSKDVESASNVNSERAVVMCRRRRSINKEAAATAIVCSLARVIQFSQEQLTGGMSGAIKRFDPREGARGKV